MRVLIVDDQRTIRISWREQGGQDVGAQRIVHHVGFAVIVQSFGDHDHGLAACCDRVKSLADHGNQAEQQESGRQGQGGDFVTNGELHGRGRKSVRLMSQHGFICKNAELSDGL